MDGGRLASSYKTPSLVIRIDKIPLHEYVRNDTAKSLVRNLAFGILTLLCHFSDCLE